MSSQIEHYGRMRMSDGLVFDEQEDYIWITRLLFLRLYLRSGYNVVKTTLHSKRAPATFSYLAMIQNYMFLLRL